MKLTTQYALAGLAGMILVSGISAPARAAEGASFKSCDTSESIRDHIGPTTKDRLINDGVIVSDINDRFCVHTVKAGVQSLAGIPSDNSFYAYDYQYDYWKLGLTMAFRRAPVEAGLLLAIADVGHGYQWTAHDQAPTMEAGVSGATFEEAQQACASLTLLGKSWAVPMMKETNAKPRETNWKRSFEHIMTYLADPEMYLDDTVPGSTPYRSGAFWSASVDGGPVHTPMAWSSQPVQNDNPYTMLSPRVASRRFGVICVAQ